MAGTDGLAPHTDAQTINLSSAAGSGLFRIDLTDAVKAQLEAGKTRMTVRLDLNIRTGIPLLRIDPATVAGSLTGSNGVSSGRLVVNSSHLPSGDHCRPAGGRSVRVSCSVSRVSAHITCACMLPDRSDRNAIRLPSGDQTGAESRQVPSVS